MARTTTKPAATAAPAQPDLLAQALTPDTISAPAEVAARPSSLEIIASSRTLIARAAAFVVNSPETYAEAIRVCQELKGAHNMLEADRLEITRPIDQSKERVMAFFKPATTAVATASNTLKDSAIAWANEQRRIEDEIRRKAEAEAERQRKEAEAKAKAERDAAELKARQEREAAEQSRREQEAAERRVQEQREAEELARRNAEEARRRGDEDAARKANEAEQAAKAAREADERLARNAQAAAVKSDAAAVRTEERGEQKAQALEVQATTIVAPVVETRTVKVSGTSRRTVWKFKVLDETKIQRQFFARDDAKIQKLVNTMHKDAVSLVGEGGIEVWEEADLAIGAKK